MSPIYPGIPYGPAPVWSFIIAELTMYLLFLLCLRHAFQKGRRHVSYLLGGLIFGVLLECMEVHTMGHYTYGRFIVMIGKPPLDVPLCIGMGWAIIMYTGRLFSDKLGLPLLACAALDTLLAINIDLSMDIVAYRLHMWNWSWGPESNPLTAQWFGIPYGNFVGWETVVLCYSAFSRLFERRIIQHKDGLWRFISTTVLALICSLIILYSSEAYLFPWLRHQFGITTGQRFIVITLFIFIICAIYWRRKEVSPGRIPGIVWWVHGWFHLYFFACLFICGFYLENRWMTLAACTNFIIGIFIHLYPLSLDKKQQATMDNQVAI